MGLSFGDFNRDGLLDLFGSNFGNHAEALFSPDLDFSLEQGDSRWFLQRSDGTFLDRADQGLIHTPFGWGTSAIDYENDGDTDLLMHGGLDNAVLVLAAPATVLENDGQGDFSRNTTALANSTDHVRRTVHGMAVGDLSNDGFVDIVSVSNFDFPEPFPLVPSPELGGEFDVDAAFVPTFTPIDPENFVFTWNGLVFPDGTLSVELSSGDNGNGWAQIQVMGSIGLTTDGRANRDGIGAVVRFEPQGDWPVLQPVLGGSSHASQDSLIATFGLGRARWGTAEVLWPGGVRNRLYGVRDGERLTFPEIPCSFDSGGSFPVYLGCIAGALHDLHTGGAIDRRLKGRLFWSAILAFLEEGA